MLTACYDINSSPLTPPPDAQRPTDQRLQTWTLDRPPRFWVNVCLSRFLTTPVLLTVSICKTRAAPLRTQSGSCLSWVRMAYPIAKFHLAHDRFPAQIGTRRSRYYSRRAHRTFSPGRPSGALLPVRPRDEAVVIRSDVLCGNEVWAVLLAAILAAAPVGRVGPVNASHAVKAMCSQTRSRRFK